MIKKNSVYRHLCMEFERCLAGAFHSRFGVAVEMKCDDALMRTVPARVDGKPLTCSQREFIQAYENGYFQEIDRAYARKEVA